MLLSIHIAKAGGTSLGEMLKAQFGARVMLDYGDHAGYFGPEAIERRARRKAEMLTRSDEIVANYDCIHGHFLPEKYAEVFPNGRHFAIFRDPYQQTISHYRFLKRNPQIDHPLVHGIHDRNMSLLDFVHWQEAAEVQSRQLGNLPVESLEAVGIYEQFDRSIDLINATFGLELRNNVVANAGDRQHGEAYPIDPEVMSAVRRMRAGDYDVYRRAGDLFELQRRRRQSTS